VNRWLAVGLAVVLLIVSALWFAARNLGQILNENRDAIAAQVSAALGREVSFEGLGASLGWGVSGRVDGLRVGDDPAYSKDDFLRVGAAEIDVRLLPLLRGKVEVGKISLRQPEIRVIQTAAGLNVATLGGSGGAEVEESEPAEGTTPLVLAVANVEIVDARVHYIDRAVKPATETEVADFDLHVTTEGTTDAFRGRIELDAKQIQSGGAPVGWAPVALRARIARDAGLIDLSDTTLSLGALVAEIAARFRYDAGSAAIEDLVVGVLDGEIRGRGRYQLAASRFDLELEVDGLDLAEALTLTTPDGTAAAAGRLASQLKLRGAGAGWPRLSQTLAGAGEIQLEDAVLRDVNLARTALDGLTGIPGLSNLLPTTVRDKYPALFSTGDTEFESLRAHAEVGGGTLRLTGLDAAARDYQVLGSGSVALGDGRTDLASQLVLAEGVSAALVDATSELEPLRNDAGRIVVPVRIRGTIPDLTPQPDVEYVAQAVGRDKAKKLIDKTFSEESALGKGLKSLLGQ
jgi:hypothetical protein